MNTACLRLGAVLAISAMSGCVTLPELNLAPQAPIPIDASLEKTWQSALDLLAEQGVAVRTVEKSTGFIASETIALPMFVTDPKWADCGTFAGFPLTRRRPSTTPSSCAKPQPVR